MTQRGDPDAIVEGLERQGFTAFKREVTDGARGCAPIGGLWQGLDARTGAVASVIWTRADGSGDADVFLDITGALAMSLRPTRAA